MAIAVKLGYDNFMNYVIRLSHLPAEACEAVTVDDHGRRLGSVSLQRLEDCEQLPGLKQLVVLMPGQNLSLLPVDLPKMSASELLEAIPYALEDQIADDVDNMFYVKASPVVSSPLVVAAINRTLFLGLHERLKSLAVNVPCLIADSLALSWQKNHWSLAFLGDTVLWRYGAQLGVSFDREQFSFYWPLIIKQQAESLPGVIDVYGDASQDGHFFAQIGVALDWHARDDWLDAVSILQPQPLNLLQGRYRLHTRLGKIKRRWLQCAAVSVLCLLVVFSINVAGYFYMRHENIQLLAKIDQLMTASGVNASAGPGQARDLITEEMAHYQRLQQANTWFNLMDRVGPVIQKDEHWQLQALDYGKGQLNITLQASGAASLQQLMAQISELGLSVKQLAERDNQGQVTILVSQTKG